MRLQSGDLRGEDTSVREAARFAVGVAIVAVLFLVAAAVWVSTCAAPTDVDTVACGAVQRTTLALGSPVIFLLGGLWAFWRTYRAWRDYRTWWAWQGAGWFLLTAMLVVLTMALPAMVGSAPGG